MSQATAHQFTEDQASPRPWSHGTFYWNELHTRDIERARKFYADTLGWVYEPFPMADGATYWIAKAGTETAGGLFEMKDACFEGVPEAWMAFIAVDDVDKRVEKAVAAGAKLMRPVFDVPGVGRIAVLREPGGAGIGWMTPVTA
jgi:predicted enzyme related to lactoylglutathione lyase